jgi:hypothetical protein
MKISLLILRKCGGHPTVFEHLKIQYGDGDEWLDLWTRDSEWLDLWYTSKKQQSGKMDGCFVERKKLKKLILIQNKKDGYL